MYFLRDVANRQIYTRASLEKYIWKVYMYFQMTPPFQTYMFTIFRPYIFFHLKLQLRTSLKKYIRTSWMTPAKNILICTESRSHCKFTCKPQAPIFFRHMSKEVRQYVRSNDGKQKFIFNAFCERQCCVHYLSITPNSVMVRCFVSKIILSMCARWMFYRTSGADLLSRRYWLL